MIIEHIYDEWGKLLKLPSKNDTHPELKDGEVFLTNCKNDITFDNLIYQTKRKGVVAYNRDGSLSSHNSYIPVFVQVDEYNNFKDLGIDDGCNMDFLLPALEKFL